MRLHRRFVQNLSIKYLKQKHEKVVKVNADMRKLGRVEWLLNMLKDIGVPSEAIYDLILQGKRRACPMHHISGYTKYDVLQYRQIRAALETHLKYGPMVAVFWISANYNGCMKNGTIYRFTGLHVSREEEQEDEGEKEKISHAVCVVGFGIEEKVPFFMFRIDVRLASIW